MVGGSLALFYIYQMNRVNSRKWLCHDDNTINIVLDIIIIIIIIVNLRYEIVSPLAYYFVTSSTSRRTKNRAIQFARWQHAAVPNKGQYSYASQLFVVDWWSHDFVLTRASYNSRKVIVIGIGNIGESGFRAPS